MNKLLFTLEKNWGEDVVLVANNEKDLGDYLTKEGGYYSALIDNGSVFLRKDEHDDYEIGNVKWIKHV